MMKLEVNKRTEEITSISEDIEKINQFYKDLQEIIESQQQDINLIENYTELTLRDVKEAETELKIANEYSSSVSKLKLFAYSIPAVFGIVLFGLMK